MSLLHEGAIVLAALLRRGAAPNPGPLPTPAPSVVGLARDVRDTSETLGRLLREQNGPLDFQRLQSFGQAVSQLDQRLQALGAGMASVGMRLQALYRGRRQ